MVKLGKLQQIKMPDRYDQNGMHSAGMIILMYFAFLSLGHHIYDDGNDDRNDDGHDDTNDDI